jgi:hypothetical protein
MSSLTTTTVNTKDGVTNLTLTTGNTTGPALVVSSSNTLWIRANSSVNVFTINTTSAVVNTPATFNNNVAVTGVVTITGNVSTTDSLAVTNNAVVSNGLIVSKSATFETNTFTLGSYSAANPGYTRLPNGLLLQWGNVTINSTSGTITFPAAFGTVYSVQLTPSSNTQSQIPAVTSVSLTTATVRSANATSNTVYWLAIGS